MRATICTLFLALFFTISKAQDCDIATTGVAVVNAGNTAPIGSICVGQSANFKFSIGNFGTDLGCTIPANSVTAIFDFPTIGGGIKPYIYNGPLTFTSGYFTWTYNSLDEVLEGTNTLPIPNGLGDADILVSVLGNASGSGNSNLNLTQGLGISDNVGNDVAGAQLIVGVTCPANLSVCFNASPFALSTLLPSGNPPGGVYSGAGVSGGIFNPAAAGAGPHTITYTYTHSNGCISTCNFIITVNPVVTCPGNMSVCFNTPAFTLTGQSPTGGTFSGAGITEDQFDPAAAGVGPHTITYTFTDGNLCTNSCTFTITVTANVTPTVTIAASPSGTICAGTSVTFTATAANFDGGTVSNYNFKVNGSSVQSGASNTYTTSSLVNGNLVTCEITITGGTCLTSATATSNTITMSVTANVTPTVTIAASPSGTICAGTSVTFTATAANFDGGTVSNYNFKVNGSSVQSGASNTYTTSSLVNGNLVTCEITITGGTCLTSATATSNTITMSVTANVTPTVTIAASPSGTICAGTSVTFTATAANFDGGTVSNYNFKVNGSSVQSGASNTYTTSSLVNGNLVTCEITITGGTCLTSPTATSNTITMSVTANVTPTVTIAASPSGTICAGTSVTFTATAANFDGGTVSNYNFKVNGSSVQNSALNTYTTTTLANGNLVTCEITITGGTCLTSPTATSNTITMSVTANVTPTVTIAASPSGTICAGTSVTFTATAANFDGGTVSNYNFKVNGSSVQSGASNTYTTSSLVNGNLVTCEITITGGTCLTSPTATSNTITMSVTANVTPTVTIAASPSGTICAGTSVTFTATAANFDGGTVSNYNFKVNGSSVQSGASNTYTTSSLVNGNLVTCEITITGGTCLTSATATSNTITMSVTANVTPTVTIAASPSGTICAGTSVTFTATAANFDGGTVSNYNFKVNGSSVQSGASNTYTTSSLVNGNLVTCEITITGGTCLTSPTATSNTITMSVTANVTPTVTIAASPSGTICAGTSVTFTATAANFDGGTVSNYNFKVNGSSVQSGASNMYTTSSLVNGNLVTCEITITGGTCLTSPTATSNTITMSVNATCGCTLTVNAGPDKVLCNASSSFTLTANVTGISAGTPPLTPFTEASGSTSDKRIFSGNIDYITIGNTFSQSEDRNNCNKNSTASKTLTLPAGAVVKKAYLYWSGSGSLDNTVKLNSTTVTADGTKTYSRSGGFNYFGARKDVTSMVTSSGTYTVSDLTWSNGSPYCNDNSAYGAWAMTVVYELASLPSARVHINTEKFQFTYPADCYTTSINNINLPAGCSSNAKLTIVAFEGDNYKGEGLTIGGVNYGDNNFRGQSGPNLDILSWNIPSLVTSGSSTLSYSITSYLSNTVFGPAIEGLFDYVKVLKYNYCPPNQCNVTYQWKKGATIVGTTQNISVSTPGTYTVTATDCAGCTATDEVIVTASTLSASASVGTIACNGGTTTVTITATGGTAPYSGTGVFIRGAGTCNFTVTDAKGCTKTIPVTVTEPSALIVTATAPVIPCGSTTTTVTVNATGGTAPYTGTGTFTKSPGTWTFTVTDARGCTCSKTIVIANPCCGPVDPDKCYKLIARHSGKALTVAGSSTSNGGNVEQRAYTEGNNQIWKFVEVESGFYKIINVNSNKVLEVNGGSTANGANVQQWNYEGDNEQKWSLTSTSSYFIIKAKHSGKAASVAGSSTSNGANVEQRGNGSNYNEQWSIIEVDCPGTTYRSTNPVVSNNDDGNNEEEIIVLPQKKEESKIVPKETKELKAEINLDAAVRPNPSISYFNLIIKSNDNNIPADVKIYDLNSRIVATYFRIGPNSILKIDTDKWAAGVYYAEVMQGAQRKVLKIIKAGN